MSRKWQEKNAEGGATIQIPDNCVPKTEQSRNSGIPQEISASVSHSLSSLQSLRSFRSYVIPDPRRPPQHSQNGWVKFHRAHTFCFHGLQSGDRTAVCCCSVNARHNLSRGFPSPRCCVGVLEVFGLLIPGNIILPFIIKKKPQGWIDNT